MGLGFQPSQETKSMYGARVGYGNNIKNRNLGMSDKFSGIQREGTIKTVYFKTRMPSCDVSLSKGGLLKFVPYPGGNLDEITGFLHGDFIAPIVGQKCIISFSEGNTNSPYISELMFRPGSGLGSPQYKINWPLLNNEDDICRGHKNGCFQKFSTDIITQLPKIETGFNIIVDPLGTGKITQSTDILTGVTMGDGGGLGLHQPIACANVNYVMTPTGPSPILPAFAFGPRTGQGTHIYG